MKRIIRAVGLSIVLVGCHPDSPSPSEPVTPAAPTVISTNDVLGITMGDPCAYDATKSGTVFSDPAGKGLTYSITFSGSASGLQSSGGMIGGIPQTSGFAVATVTATDALGRTAVDQFPIVIFPAGIQTPLLPATSFHYTDALPAHFTTSLNGTSVVATDNTPSTNPTTDAGATLGRVLFYDPRLSKNDATPCASCHNQSIGFTDAFPFSVGFAGGLTGRHTPALANARFYQRGKFFWDERAASLEEQVLGPIQNPVEMGMSLDTLVLKLRATSYYAPLFTAAFGTRDITSDRVSRALAQYVRSMVSAGSRYDRAFDASGQPNFAASFTSQEIAGEQLFRSAGCAQCHTTVAQVSDAPHNTGLDAINTDIGTGRGAVKVASLRNVAVRPRYMHDGRFSSLEQVVDFYDAGVKDNPDLDPRLRSADGSVKRLGLTAQQKASLIAFLKTLTDSTFLTDARYSDPFARVVVVPPSPPPSPAPSGNPGSLAINIQGNAYHPASATVAPGATISFTNLDNRRHSAMFFSNLIVSTPIFTSGTQAVTMPTQPGTYNFQCAVHGAAMTGVITVQ